jgi:L,D-transpeptidase ErfK/SrfK
MVTPPIRTLALFALVAVTGGCSMSAEPGRSTAVVGVSGKRVVAQAGMATNPPPPVADATFPPRPSHVDLPAATCAAGGGDTRRTTVDVRLPTIVDLPPVLGCTWRHVVQPGEDLLTIARTTGIGFRELRDANPHIDEFEPRPGVEILVPAEWILPRATYRGLVINIAELRLYYFPSDPVPGDTVPLLTWPVGIGAEEAPSPVGEFVVKSKDENPTWYVPASIYRTMDHPRRIVPPGDDNPLGTHRIKLSIDVYAIHGTNSPWSVGRLTTHGCVRLYPEDILDLYPRVSAGTRGEFIYQPVKLGTRDGRIFVEVHRDVYQMHSDLEALALAEIAAAGVGERVDRDRLRSAVEARSGVPTDVTRDGAAPWVPTGAQMSGVPASTTVTGRAPTPAVAGAATVSATP